MDYDDALDYEPTDDEIKAEIARHGLDWDDFMNEVARPDEGYTGSDVLAWLGY